MHFKMEREDFKKKKLYEINTFEDVKEIMKFYP